jgi:peptidoglycan-associated lipoprotein
MMMRYTRFGSLFGMMLGLTVAQAQNPAPLPRPAVGFVQGFDAGVGFATVYTNASPGTCGCFFMYGVNARASVLESHHLATVLDVGITHKSNVNGNDYQLTLQTYTVGERYERGIGHGLSPFVEALAGLAHSNTNYQLDDNKTGFAALAGGGLDLKVTPKIDFRLVEADYLPNRIPNAANNWQNQLRLTAGVVFRFKDQ